MKIDWEKHPNAMFISKKVINEFPFGHIQSTTYGPKRLGKSIFCIKAMMDQYEILWPDKEYGHGVDWRFNKALDNTIYSITDLIKKVEGLQRRYESFEGGRTPRQYEKRAIAEGFPEVAIHCDDGGVGFNRYLFFTDRQIVQELKNFTDTIGTVVTWLTISTPSVEGVLTFIRKYEGWVTHIIKASSDFRRIAKHYKVLQLPSGTQRIKQPKGDPFNAWLPDDLYKKYRKKRGSYLNENIERLRKYQKKLNDKNQRDPGLEKEVMDAGQDLRKLKNDNMI